MDNPPSLKLRGRRLAGAITSAGVSAAAWTALAWCFAPMLPAAAPAVPFQEEGAVLEQEPDPNAPVAQPEPPPEKADHEANWTPPKSPPEHDLLIDELPYENGWRLDGGLAALFRYRRSAYGSKDSDTDLTIAGVAGGSLLDGDGAEVLRFQFDGALLWDLDGFGAATESFSGLQESYNSRVHGFVYSAWVESDTLADPLRVRVGRQEILRQDALYFDGARVGVAAQSDLSFSLYGGVPVHFYESSRSGDLLAGAGVEWAATRDIRLTLDEVYVTDEQRWFGQLPVVRRDLLSLFTGKWLATDSLLVRGSASWIDDQDRRQEVFVSWYDADSPLRATLQVRRQSDYGEVVSTEFSPYQAVLEDVAPYWTTTAQVFCEVSSATELSVGGTVRQLENDSDEGDYNREFTRAFGTVTTDDFLVDDVDAGARADVWTSSGDYWLAYGFFLGYEWAEHSRAEIGTDFQLYRYDVLTGSLYTADRQYYVRGRVPVTDDLDFQIRYAMNRSYFGTDHTIEGSLGLEF